MILLIILGLVASLSFIDGIMNIFSTKYFIHRQKFLHITTEAPSHTDSQKYYSINRIIAGFCSVGAGSVIVIWIFEAIKAGVIK